MFKENITEYYMQLIKPNQKGENIIKIRLNRDNNNLEVSNDLENVETKMEEKRFKIVNMNEFENNLDVEAPLFYVGTVNNFIVSAECFNYPDVEIEDVLLYHENANEYMLLKK